MKITRVTIRSNAAGAGWFVLVQTEDGEEHSVGDQRLRGEDHVYPIFDVIHVQAEAARWTTAMLLGREYT